MLYRKIPSEGFSSTMGHVTSYLTAADEAGYLRDKKPTWDRLYQQFKLTLESILPTGRGIVDTVHFFDPKNPQRGEKYGGQKQHGDGFISAIWTRDEIESNWLRVQEFFLNQGKMDFPNIKEHQFGAGDSYTTARLAAAADNPEMQAAIVISGLLFQMFGSRNISTYGFQKHFPYKIFENIRSAMIEGIPDGWAFPDWSRNSTEVLQSKRCEYFYRPLILNEMQAMDYFARETALMLSDTAYMRIQFSDKIDETYEIKKEAHEKLQAIEDRRAHEKLVKEKHLETLRAQEEAQRAAQAKESAMRKKLEQLLASEISKPTESEAKKGPEPFPHRVEQARKREIARLERALNPGAENSIATKDEALKILSSVPIDELSSRIWKHPMSKVSKELNVSSTELSNYCRSNGIKTPTSAYWAEVGFGTIEPTNGTPHDNPKYFRAPLNTLANSPEISFPVHAQGINKKPSEPSM